MKIVNIVNIFHLYGFDVLLLGLLDKLLSALVKKADAFRGALERALTRVRAKAAARKNT